MIHYQILEIFFEYIVYFFNPNQTGGGANLPPKFSNAYSSGTESRIDLTAGCKFEFVPCLEV